MGTRVRWRALRRPVSSHPWETIRMLGATMGTLKERVLEPSSKNRSQLSGPSPPMARVVPYGSFTA